MFRDLGFTVLSTGTHQLGQVMGTKDTLTRIPIRPHTCNCEKYERLLVSIKNQIYSRTRKNLEREFIIFFLLDTKY